MKKVIVPALIALFFVACSKPVVVKPEPPSEASLSRSLVYTNRNNTTNSTIYFGKERVEGKAAIADGKLYITIDAGPKTNGDAGESIVYQLDAAHIQTGLTKNYSFHDPAAKVIACRYSYIKKEINGDLWASLTDSDMGTQFEGGIKISSYDASRKLIAGEYQVTVRGLLVDPTKNSIGLPIDPLNKCDLTVAGEFSNVKIK